MMLPTDIALIQDNRFKDWVRKYARDEQLFFKDFAKAFAELLAKGCPAHVQPDFNKSNSASYQTSETNSSSDAEFRDLAMHGALERMKELNNVNVNSIEVWSNRTALHKAAYFGHSHVVEYLTKDEMFQNTINVNVPDAEGDTPLHDAARFGHVQVVETLLQAGADPSIPNRMGQVPADLAKAQEHFEVEKLLTRVVTNAKNALAGGETAVRNNGDFTFALLFLLAAILLGFAGEFHQRYL